MGTIIFILGIFLFIGLVIVHEMGHFWAARRNGVEVEEFGIFFPPKLWKKKMKGGWDFTINLLPLGGFVKLKGEHDSDTHKGSFGAASDWAKTKIMLAGVAVNFVTALVLFTLLALVGMPKLLDNQFTVASDTKVVHRQLLVTYVEPGSPAEKAGLKAEDTLLGIKAVCQGVADCKQHSSDLTKVDAAQVLPTITKQYADQKVELSFQRKGAKHLATVMLRDTATVEASKKTQNPKGYLGVQPKEYILQRSTWSAPVVALGLSAQFTKMTFQGLGHALQGLGGIIAGVVTGNTPARQQAQTAASSQVSGPLGIFVVLKSGSTLGFQFMLMIIAVISLTLAIMNVLPIPALDGGRLYMMLISRLTKEKRLTPKLEETIVGASFMALIVLIILITIVDVKRFF
ncbi:MAG: M50 family metallopeptidase [Candidatus Saccharimonadales bacterium]